MDINNFNKESFRKMDGAAKERIRSGILEDSGEKRPNYSGIFQKILVAVVSCVLVTAILFVVVIQGKGNPQTHETGKKSPTSMINTTAGAKTNSATTSPEPEELYSDYEFTVIIRGSEPRYLEPAPITTKDEFYECLDEIGMKDWNSDVLNSLKSKVEEGLFDNYFIYRYGTSCGKSSSVYHELQKIGVGVEVNIYIDEISPCVVTCDSVDWVFFITLDKKLLDKEINVIINDIQLIYTGEDPVTIIPAPTLGKEHKDINANLDFYKVDLKSESDENVYIKTVEDIDNYFEKYISDEALKNELKIKYKHELENQKCLVFYMRFDLGDANYKLDFIKTKDNVLYLSNSRDFDINTYHPLNWFLIVLTLDSEHYNKELDFSFSY